MLKHMLIFRDINECQHTTTATTNNLINDLPWIVSHSKRFQRLHTHFWRAIHFLMQDFS